MAWLIVDAKAKGNETERDFPACGAGVEERHERGGAALVRRRLTTTLADTGQSG